MKMLLVGDIQLQKSNLIIASELFKLVESYNLPVVWLGDILERRGLIEAKCLNAFFTYLASSKQTHYIVIGNHCLLNLYTAEHSLESLKAIPNVNIYDKPGQLGNMLFMPYYRDADKFLEDMRLWLTRLPKNPILLCHQGIKEFTIGSGYTENEAIGLSDVQEFSLVVAGHYHTPKDMANVCYLGSPFSHSFGESNEHKRLGILNTEAAQIEFIPLDIFPKHITINLDLNNMLEKIDYNPRDFVRVIATGTQKQIEEFRLKYMFSGVKWIFKPTDQKTTTISETLSNEQKWVKWAKEVKKLDDTYIQLGLDLLHD